RFGQRPEVRDQYKRKKTLRFVYSARWRGRPQEPGSPVSRTVARLATDLSRLTLGRTVFVPTGRHTKFHEGIATSNPFCPAEPGHTECLILVRELSGHTATVCARGNSSTSLGLNHLSSC